LLRLKSGGDEAKANYATTRHPVSPHGLLNFAEDITTLDNKNYREVAVSKVDENGIIIRFSAGIGRVAFTNLPAEVQKKYGYDPVKAAKIAAKQTKIKPLDGWPRRTGMSARATGLK